MIRSGGGGWAHPGCWYMKLCKRVSALGHPAEQLVAGFLPIEYYDLFVAFDAVRGPPGGSRFAV